MLETKIEELTMKLDALIAVVEELTVAMSEKPVEAPKVETALTPEPQPEPAKDLTHDDLQDLCMKIVREDRSKKEAIMKVIASFGGASTLKEVEARDLEALKVLLEGLWDER